MRRQRLGQYRVLTTVLVTISIGCGGDDFDRDPRSLPDAPVVADTLCMSLYYPLGDSDPQIEERARQLGELEELGIRKVRRAIRWDVLEPIEGDLRWERIEPGILDTLDRGIEIIANLGYGVPWASSATDDDPFYPPDDVSDFAAYAGAVADRFGDGVRLWEIWNEQNAGYRFWKPEAGGDAVGYGELLAAAAAAIHAADADADVVYGGTFYHSQFIPGAVEFMGMHFEARASAAQDFDSVAFHPYPNYPPLFPPEFAQFDEQPISEMVTSVRGLLDSYEVGDRDLHATELGWPSFEEVSRDDQAAYLARATLWLAASKVKSACWFTLDDGPRTGQGPPEDDFGLIDWDLQAAAPGQRKPSWFAMQTLASVFADVAFARDDTRHYGIENGWALRFASSDGQKQVLALWTMSDDDAQLVTVEGDGWAAISATGDSVAVERNGSSVIANVASLPVYLVR